MAVLRCADIDRERLAAVAEALAGDGEGWWLWSTSAGDWRLRRWHAGALPEDSEEGRLFSRAGELRWRRIGADPKNGVEAMRAVFLGDAAPPAIASFAVRDEELARCRRSEAPVVLWGRLLERGSQPVWFEQQIPHRLRYEPEAGGLGDGEARGGDGDGDGDAPERVALLQEEWRSGQGLQLCRWKALVPFQFGEGE
ncbi:MAG: hypothetical protein HYV63_07610 [Candidatus Schekmanbacteria bacterium]|nr:hypothetical protein [Candidatus Schekmanbacteria bacterium]